ncbi:MAG: saccharopine dehydrogenase NADP-binding domain-containing protein [Gammaproteobacteria bacterium]|nr:saccharopine dehydrogenase NADP-binding domain-containing protein [Gammaproteobacteria bacterium]
MTASLKEQHFRVLVIGGYGNFGTRITAGLKRVGGLEVVVVGRDDARAQRTAQRLGAEHACLDIRAEELAATLRGIGGDLIVSAVGPFQQDDYRLARAAIEAGMHYVDISDSRPHVCGITGLDRAAREKGVMVVGGASSVPALSSAVIDASVDKFSILREVDYGISASELTPGLAAVRATLSYCGKPIPGWQHGRLQTHYGWGGWSRFRFAPPMNRRWLARCDIPDLELFPARYPNLEKLEFRAGVAMWPTMLGLGLLSSAVRAGVLKSVEGLAPVLKRVAATLEPLGSGHSGMYVRMKGMDRRGRSVEKVWQLIARDNDGSDVPCMGAVALVRRISRCGIPGACAMPCVGLLSLDDYLAELTELNLEVTEKTRIIVGEPNEATREAQGVSERG